MRLTPQAQAEILETCESFFPKEADFKIYLFGSRVHDEKRGGDIDLAIIISDEELCRSLKMIDYKIISSLKQKPHIGDQKIDLKILSPSESQSSFFSHALRDAVVLR